MVGRWVDRTIVPLSNGPKFILIDWEQFSDFEKITLKKICIFFTQFLAKFLFKIILNHYLLIFFTIDQLSHCIILKIVGFE